MKKFTKIFLLILAVFFIFNTAHASTAVYATSDTISPFHGYTSSNPTAWQAEWYTETHTYGGWWGNDIRDDSIWTNLLNDMRSGGGTKPYNFIILVNDYDYVIAGNSVAYCRNNTLSINDCKVNSHIRYYVLGTLNADNSITFAGSPTTTINNILPTANSTTSSTSVTVSADYYLTSPDIGNYPTFPLYIVATLARTDTPATSITHSFGSLVANSTTSISYVFTLPTNSTWGLSFDLSGDGYYFISSLSTPISFNVVTDPTGGTSGYITCSISNLAGCFQNAIVFLFYPSSSSLSQFTGVMTTLRNKPPIGYVSGIFTALGNINLSATPILTFAQFTPLNTLVFKPIKTGLSWIMWLAFAFVLFKRFQHLDI